MNKLTGTTTANLIEKGIALLRWEATKAGGKMVLGVAGCILPLAFGGFLTDLALPSVVLCVVVLGAMAKACRGEWGVFRRRLQEIELMRLIMPFAAAYRSGRDLTGVDRDTLHQGREAVSALIFRFREEQGEWRKRGKLGRGEALAALLLDLEDTQKLINAEFGQSERALRPKPAAQLEIEAPPLDRKRVAKSGMEGY